MKLENFIFNIKFLSHSGHNITLIIVEFRFFAYIYNQNINEFKSESVYFHSIHSIQLEIWNSECVWWISNV
jgi:hypothetical protein